MTDTTETVTDAPASLSTLAPAPIHNFSPSDTYAIVSMQSAQGRTVEQRRVEIPQQFHSCPILRSLLRYFNSPECKSNSLTDVYSRILRFNAFANWAITKYPDAQALPAAVMEDFTRHLRTEKKAQQNSICVYMSGYRTALNSFLNEAYDNPALADAAATVREAMVYIPSASNRSGRTTPSLGQITDQPEKDELKIVRSTIRFCCEFLREMNEQRLELLSDDGVMQQVTNLLEKCNGDYEKLRYSTSQTDRSTAYKALAGAILNSENLRLKERLLHNSIGFAYAQIERASPLTIDEANRLIKAGLRDSGALDIYPENSDHKLYFHNIDYLYLVKHAPCEEVAFAWLLATDRVQLSGILDMRQGDLRITPSVASPIYIKNRSETSIREVPMHRSKSLQYRAYVNFDDLKTSFYKRFPETGDLLFDLPVTGNLQGIDSVLYRPLVMAAFQNTLQYQTLYGADNEIETLADIIRRVAINNRPIWNNKKRRHENAAIGITGQNPSPVKRQTISVTAIAQSRAILDTDGGNPGNEAFEKYSQEVVGADATAHSPSVKEVVYMHASETKYRLKKRALFASEVGHLMVQDARKVQAAIRDEVMISVKELKQMLGWSKEKSDESEMQEFDALLLSAQMAGFTISPFGQLEKDSKTFIITNGITAALLMSYRNECINQLKHFSVEDELKAFSIAMQAAYIEDALEKFDQKTIVQGKDILKNYTFPTPVIR
ncbi:MAG: hypothetical protein ACN6QH_24005 [Pseudomonas sp.]|uniref:hypothetical protein n=1 Tax=Pseudomonas sp. TaxID=306 RepID=UPI003D0E3E1F